MKSKIIVTWIFIMVLIIMIGIFVLTKTKMSINNGSGDALKSDQKWDDGYVITIPEGYTSIPSENIKSTTDMYAEAVAYKVDGNTTSVMVYLQNRGEIPFSKDKVCDISLYNSSGALLYKFGGIIQNSSDIEVGKRTVIQTQFIEAANNIASAEISF